MAIKKDISLESGIQVNDAYCRIENITLDKETISFNVRKYVAITLPFFHEDYLSCKYSITGKNPYEQAYEYLKTLEDFKDAIDV